VRRLCGHRARGTGDRRCEILAILGRRRFSPTSYPADRSTSCPSFEGCSRSRPGTPRSRAQWPCEITASLLATPAPPLSRRSSVRRWRVARPRSSVTVVSPGTSVFAVLAEALHGRVTHHLQHRDPRAEDAATRRPIPVASVCCSRGSRSLPSARVWRRQSFGFGLAKPAERRGRPAASLGNTAPVRESRGSS
jgi:hypothetical protein